MSHGVLGVGGKMLVAGDCRGDLQERKTQLSPSARLVVLLGKRIQERAKCCQSRRGEKKE